MTVPALLSGLRLPVIVAPMFLVSGPDLVVETCRAGLAGSFPSLNARTTDIFSGWLDEIAGRLAENGIPHTFGVNLVVHRSNPRLQADLEAVVRHRVPFVVTSLGAVRDVVDAVHSYGGLVFHDVVTARHAEKAAEAGVDGIVAVASGAGGHAGTLSPFALVAEIRSFFQGALVLSGAISTGADIAAARAMGADLAYMGTRFLATQESMASEAQKRMTAGARSADILHTPAVTGVPANFLRPSLVAAGLDPDAPFRPGAMDLANEARAWKTVWSAGQGVAAFHDVPPVAELCERLALDYEAAMRRLAADPFRGRPAPRATNKDGRDA